MDQRNPISRGLRDDFQHSRLMEEELDNLRAPLIPLEPFHRGENLRFRDRVSVRCIG